MAAVDGQRLNIARQPLPFNAGGFYSYFGRIQLRAEPDEVLFERKTQAARCAEQAVISPPCSAQE
jgi:hypothetical protein